MKPQPTTRKEWIRKGDDIAAFPFVVVYFDRATFPPSDYFATLPEALAAREMRQAQNVQQRRFTKEGGAQSKLIWGAHPGTKCSSVGGQVTMATNKPTHTPGRKIESDYYVTVQRCKMADGSWSQSNTCYQESPCGCKVIGAGNLPAPFSVQHCPQHAAALALLKSLRACLHSLESYCATHKAESIGACCLNRKDARAVIARAEGR